MRVKVDRATYYGHVIGESRTEALACQSFGTRCKQFEL